MNLKWSFVFKEGHLVRRVVVTGVGILVPGSTGKDEVFKNMSRGKVATEKVTSIDCKDLRIQVAGEIKNFNVNNYIQDRHGIKVSNLGRAEGLGLTALRMAIEDSKIDIKKEKGIAVGMGMTMTNMLQPNFDNIEEVKSLLGKDLISCKDNIENISPVSILSLICKYFDLKYPKPRIFTNACAASNYSIGFGYDEIKNNCADVAFVGGVESISLTALMGFNRLLSLTPDLCRPFSKGRKGLIVGEGAAFIILEEYERAKKRGAYIYGEIKGYGLGVDAYHITAPRADAKGAISSMQEALYMSGLIPDEIDYVSAHGTGTPLNDKTETKALKEVFKNKVPPASSIKSMIGHSLGAAGAIEAVCSLLMIENNEAMPTANFEEVDENCEIDCISNNSRKMNINNVISNAFAFGGNNSCVVISRVEEENEDE